MFSVYNFSIPIATFFNLQLIFSVKYKMLLRTFPFLIPFLNTLPSQELNFLYKLCLRVLSSSNGCKIHVDIMTEKELTSI